MKRHNTCDYGGEQGELNDRLDDKRVSTWETAGTQKTASNLQKEYSLGRL